MLSEARILPGREGLGQGLESAPEAMPVLASPS